MSGIRQVAFAEASATEGKELIAAARLHRVATIYYNATRKIRAAANT